MSEMNQKTEISKIADNLLTQSKRIAREELDKLQEASENIGKSWSGSWLGYHSKVYYKDLQPAPPGARFSKEWGLMHTIAIEDTIGDWVEHDFDTVVDRIYQTADNPDLKKYNFLIREAGSCFEESKAKLLSILSIIKKSQKEDRYLTDLIEEIKKLKIFSEAYFIEYLRPSGQQMSRDSVAIQNGLQIPPHISVIAKIYAILNPFDSCVELSKMAKKSVLHIKNLEEGGEKGRKIDNKNVSSGQKDLQEQGKTISEEHIKSLTFG